MAQQAEKKPNILVIWGDDIGISNLSCYSHGLRVAAISGSGVVQLSCDTWKQP